MPWVWEDKDILGKGTVTAAFVNLPRITPDAERIARKVNSLECDHEGVVEDRYRGFVREINSHETLRKRVLRDLHHNHLVANLRMWSAVSDDDMRCLAKELGVAQIPAGALMENLRIAGIPNFSQLPHGCLLAFPWREGRMYHHEQAVLNVYRQNMPCTISGVPMARMVGGDEKGIVQAYLDRGMGFRGLLGTVYTQGLIQVGDEVIACLDSHKVWQD